VIAQAYLNEWISQAPWPTQLQVEQDLVLSRLIVGIAGHELLGGELASRDRLVPPASGACICGRLSLVVG
jgi:hypothetical protein